METINSWHEISDKIITLNRIILSQWENTVHLSLDEHKKESDVILLDHMPEILLGLSRALRRGMRDDIELARAHGYYRAVLTQFTLADLLNEFALLRETLITYLYPMGDLEVVKYVHCYIDTMMKNSVVEFIQHNLHMPGLRDPREQDLRIQ
jgi:hypothetical protein